MQDEKANKNNPKAAFTAAFLLTAILTYLLLGLFFGFYIPCPFRTITGFRCPGCGLSHAATHIAKMDINGAFKENAMFLPIYSYIIYAAVRHFYYLFNNKDPLSDNIGKRIDLIFLFMILIWWIVRNILNI